MSKSIIILVGHHTSAIVVGWHVIGHGNSSVEDLRVKLIKYAQSGGSRPAPNRNLIKYVYYKL